MSKTNKTKQNKIYPQCPPSLGHIIADMREFNLEDNDEHQSIVDLTIDYDCTFTKMLDCENPNKEEIRKYVLNEIWKTYCDGGYKK